jgi:hypothetical protein
MVQLTSPCDLYHTVPVISNAITVPVNLEYHYGMYILHTALEAAPRHCVKYICVEMVYEHNRHC